MKVSATYPFDRLIADGYDVDYRNDLWYINGEVVGWAEAEDEPFEACGPVELIDALYRYGDNK